MQAPVAAYQGSKPFVFVCYSHEDAGSVYQEISWLQDTGIMVWYDEGISPGSEWSEELASRIEDCAVFLFYASENSVHSPHCRGEINFALDQSCHMLVVHLEDAELSAGLRLSLGARQALMKYELRDEVYQRKLLSALQMFTRSAGETPRDFVPEHLARKAIESGATMIGERKQVSVMTVSVTNVGGLWDLDPEESHEILQSCRELLASSVNRFEGTIHQFSNEGVVALFGAPIAHEDHAQRACFAALHMQEAIRGWADQLRRKKGISFSARIGIDSGEIVIKSVGDDLRVELEAHGRAVGVSASVQQLAEPSRTYISSNTARHVEGYVALRSLGNFDLQGYPDGIELFELEGMGTALTRLDRARARGLTRFVGRHNEMQSLDAALQRAREGGGQVVSVVAEAGTGKSRLCSEFVDKCRRDGLVVYQAHCPVHGKSVPLLPILELLRSYFDIAVGDQPLQAREKITGRLILLDAAFEQELPLLFEFLGVPDPDLPQSELEAEARQQRLYAFLGRLVQSHSQREPLIMFIDDLHWIDDASAGYVAHLVDAVAATNTLLLVNFRPSEYTAPWAARSYHLQMPLMPLTLDSTEELVASLVGSDSSLDGLAARIHERTQGNPFFTEEVVRTLIESGQLEKIAEGYRLSGSLDALDVPPDVQAILQARIDRLGDAEKRLLQRAAVIGKDFDETILREVSDLPEEQLDPALATLVETEFLVQRAIYPVAEYSFKHPLTHQVAQETQLKAPRQQAHAAVAEAIQRLYPDELDERAAQVARHLEGAERNNEAANWYARAAEWSEKNDLRSCVAYWQHIPELLADLDDAEADQLKLEACRKVSLLAWRVHGDASETSKIQAATEMGLAIARKLGEVNSIIEIFLGNSVQAMVVQGDYQQARELFRQAEALAEDATDPMLRVTLLFVDNMISIHTGDCDSGMAKLQVYRQQWKEVGVCPISTVPVFCTDDAEQATAGFWFAYSGELDVAISSCQAFASLAHANGNQETLGQISNLAAIQSYFYGAAIEGAGKFDADSQAAGKSLGNPNFNMIADAAHGAFLYYAGALEEARGELEKTMRDFPLGNTTNWYRAYLVKVLLTLGEPDAALQVAEEGLGLARERGAGFEQLALLTEKCRVLLATDGPSAAIEGMLKEGEALVEQTRAGAFAPQLLELRAELLLRSGQVEQAAELTRQALKGYQDTGAAGQAERLQGTIEARQSA